MNNERNKCFWCGKPQYQGMHDTCWEELKGFAMSDRKLPDVKESK